jgi:hypothetical protein
MRIVPVGTKGERRGARRLLSIVGLLLAATVLILVLASAAWAADSSTTLPAASTTVTDTSATVTTGSTTATTGAGSATTAPTTPATTIPAGTTGIIPPILGRAPLNPATWKIPQMVAQVWPEYDENAVLVIMTLDLPAEVALPATFKFAIPKGAVISGIGESDPNGKLTFNYANSYPPVDTSGTDWDIATIQVVKYRSLEIDYYYNPGLPTGAGLRSFPLLLQVPLDTAALNLHVQEPARATGFNVQPAMQGTGVAEDGFTYNVASFSDVKAGSTFGYVISYNKPDATPSATPGDSTSAKLNTTTVLIAVIAVIVIVLGGVIIYLLYRKGGKGSPAKEPAPSSQKTRNGRSAAAPAAPGKGQKQPARTNSVPKDRAKVEDDESSSDVPAGKGAGRSKAGNKTGSAEVTGYCAACGEELIKNARFCPNCGEAQGR